MPTNDRNPELDTVDDHDPLEIIDRYTGSLLWLQRNDEGLREEPAGQFGGRWPTLARPCTHWASSSDG